MIQKKINTQDFVSYSLQSGTRTPRNVANFWATIGTWYKHNDWFEQELPWVPTKSEVVEAGERSELVYMVLILPILLSTTQCFDLATKINIVSEGQKDSLYL